MGNKIAQWMLHTGADKNRQNVIWNMIGSFCYAIASLILSFLVMRLIGPVQGGVFAFAFSTFGQQMFNLAYFGLRPYHVTDEGSEFTFGDYLHHRIITCLCAVLAGILFLAAAVCSGSYTGSKAAVIFLMVLYKVIDGFADVYESEFQRNGNLYLTGKSNTFRTLLSVCSFLFVLIPSRNLILSCLMAVAAQAAGVFLFDIPVIRHLSGVGFHWQPAQVKSIFRKGGLLFLAVFLDFYILSAAKYAIDWNLNDTASGYFNIIFMPTLFINLIAGFVIRPYLTSLAAQWNQQRFEEFKDLLAKIAAVIAGLSLLASALTWVLGPWILQVLEGMLGVEYRGKLVCYHLPFVIIVMGGGFYAIMNLMYYALVIMRKQNLIFYVYAGGAVAAYFIAPYMVNAWQIPGAASAYLVLMIILTLCFGIMSWTAYRKGSRGAVSHK